jgi:hypothetical protein
MSELSSLMLKQSLEVRKVRDERARRNSLRQKGEKFYRIKIRGR